MGSLSELNLLAQRGGFGAVAPFMTNDYPSASCLFKCSECPMVKYSCEDLEVHVKVEHLNWLPFQCTLCAAQRASDNQMREHVISHHKKNDYRYVYVDNPTAKRQLQAMIERALGAAIQQLVAKRLALAISASPKTAPLPSPGTHATNGVANLAKRKRLHDVLSRNLSHEPENDMERSSSSVSPVESTVSATATVVSKRSDNILNGFSQDDYNDPPNLSEDMNAQLSALLGQAVQQQQQQQDDDYDEAGVSSTLLKTLEQSLDRNGASNVGGEIDAATLIQNVSSMFHASNLENFGLPLNGKAITPPTKQIRRRPGTSTQCVSKKRVLGECNKCNKPVTAGARQMHMFFHLGKDENTYRFKCKFPNCNVEHYRKDQMENHMSKQHGHIDHDMMIDRSVELYERVQKLSMELLGTREMRRPGQANSAENAADSENNAAVDPLDLVQQVSSPANSTNGAVQGKYVRPGNEENLECKLCHKFIINRTRGFHILWHLCNDLGVIRYCCRLCDYKHERPQSVTTHGKKEHGTEDVLKDSLPEYEEEVKSMSKACFGLEQLFSKESRRRSKFAREAKPAADDGASVCESVGSSAADEAKAAAADAACGGASPQRQTPTKAGGAPAKEHAEAKPDTPTKCAGGGSAARRRLLNRRFGIRRPKSKKQRQEMAKLREVSMRIGGAAYFKKRAADQVYCEECGKYVCSRLTEHAYAHMPHAQLFLCPHCDMGHWSRALVQRHLKDLHASAAQPTDNRLRYAALIKDTIRRCYPPVFVDAPVPTAAEVQRLKRTLDLSDDAIALQPPADEEEEEEDLESDDANEDEVEEDEESRNETDERDENNDEENDTSEQPAKLEQFKPEPSELVADAV